MGRRWGKTFMAGVYSLTCADLGGVVAWVVPTYKNARAPWRFAEQQTAQAKHPRLRINRTERMIEFPSGGRLTVYSADNDTALRGEAFDVVVVDEAAMVREETYTDVLLPTLADRDGRILLISTPKGRNWFWREWLRGNREQRDIMAFHAPTRANPIPAIQHAATMARERVSERTYRQEWLAEFLEDGGGVFRGIRALATAHPQERAADGHHYVMGVDWGRTNDATVLVVIDVTLMQVCAVDRMLDTDYTLQTTRLRGLWERFGQCVIIAEQNSMGGPLVERLAREGLRVRGFVTTNATKAGIIDALALAFETSALALLNDPALIGELEAYEAETLPSGLIRYSAPAGMHDDHVMALALAYSGVGRASSAVGAFL